MYGLSIFDHFLSQAVIPKLYFEAVSQEQRIQFLAKYCQALEDWGESLRKEQTAINVDVDKRLTNLETRMTAAEARLDADEQAFDDFVTQTGEQFAALTARVVALENGKMDIDDTYTRAQMDARYVRLEDTMAWQGYFLGNICETLPRDAVASYDYYSSATDSGSKATIKVVAKAA